HVNMRSNSGNTFDEFTYKEKMLDKIEGYHTEESATKPLNQTEELLKHTIDKYFNEFIHGKDLDNIQKEQAKQFFQQEKGLFAQSTKELEKTS
ncbi:42789_t:CDS:2, partial [Gigaspora margarita]